MFLFYKFFNFVSTHGFRVNPACCILYFMIPVMGVSFSANAAVNLKKTLSLGYFYSEGRYYDDSNIIIQSIPVALKLQYLSTRFKIATSVNSIDNPNSTKSSLLESNQGLGNTYVSLHQIVSLPYSMQFIDFGGKVKIPTATHTPSRRVNRFDAELSSNMYQGFANNWLTFKLAYRWRYDPTLNNTAAISSGASHTFNAILTSGVIADYRQSATSTGEPRKELMLYLQHKSKHAIRYTYYVIKGFSKASPDWASGIQVGYKW